MTSEENTIDLGKLADEEIEKIGVGFPDYGLTENPFPTSAIAMKTRLFNFNNKFRYETFEDIARKIVHTARTGRYRGMVILGDFGLGKTYTLYYFSDLINKQLGKRQEVKSMAIYLSSCGVSLNDFLSNFIQEITIETIIQTIYQGKQDVINSEVIKFSEDVIKRVEAQLAMPYRGYADKETLAKLKQKCEEIKKGECDLEVLRLAIDDAITLYSHYSNSASSDFIRQIFAVLKNEQVFALEDYSYCFSILLFSRNIEKRKIATKFILGDKLSASENKILNLTLTELSPTDISKRVFPDILKILHTYGEQFNMVFVFVDEFEKIVLGLKGAKRFDFLEDLRSLIDYNLSQFSLVLGCSTEAYETIRGTSPAFSDRNRDVIDLPRIKSINDVKNLVQVYLSDRRTPNFNGLPCHPFSDSALMTIAENENGSPRYILEACHKILNYGLQMDAKVIDDKVLKTWYGK